MRPTLLTVFSLVAAFGFLYWYAATAAICPAPLSYRLGDHDERFLLNPEDTRATLLEAERLWEEATGRELFVYDEQARFTVNFIFDERQKLAVKEEDWRERLDEQERAGRAAVAAVRLLGEEYRALRQVYDAEVARYETNLEAHNRRVEAINAQGGALPEELSLLRAEEQKLLAAATELSRLADQLNVLARRIKTLGAEGNRLIEEYNRNAADYNQRFVDGSAFTQAEYVGGRINVYKYTDRTELLRAMAHEFGHALGLGHIADQNSVMYHMMREWPDAPRLSAEDLAEFRRVCGTGEELSHQVRRLVREGLERR
jgi:regulator of replication initiation timing